MKPKQRSVYSQLQKSRHSSQNTIHTGSEQERCKKPSIGIFQLLDANCPYSSSLPLHKTCRSYTAFLLCKSVATEMLGSGHVYCPKVYIYQLKIKGPSLQNLGQFPNCQYKIPIHKCFLNRFFSPFLPFLPYFFLPYSPQVGDGMKNGCSRAHYSPRNAWAASRETQSRSKVYKVLKGYV